MLVRRWIKLSTVFLLVFMSLSSIWVSARALTAAPYSPNGLSAGLYWFGLNDSNQKFVSGEANTYFDPSKPTMIFVHGWQPYLSNNMPNFNFNSTDTAAAWINDGWNVGLFVWNQFSDETTGTLTDDWFANGDPPQGAMDAEAKIWTTGGPQGMRWRDWDDLIDGYSDAPAGTPSAAELFYQDYVAAMTAASYSGGNIRIVGHSLGNQMATRFTKLVHDGITSGAVPEHLRPTRVALLDPYWSPGAKSYLGGKTNAQMVREYIAELVPTGTLFEWYRSSDWTTPTEADANVELEPLVLYAEMDPDFAANGKDKHMAAQHLYFWSYAFAGPTACSGPSCLAMDKVLSKMDDAQLAAVTRSDYAWTQTAGNLTATPEDDVYQSQLRAGAPYTVALLSAAPISQSIGSFITVTARVSDAVGLAGDGTLVSFASDFGEIAARSVTSQGLALAHISASQAGTATITATTQGTGGVIQASLVVTFTDPFDFHVHLPLLLKNY